MLQTFYHFRHGCNLQFAVSWSCLWSQRIAEQSTVGYSLLLCKKGQGELLWDEEKHFWSCYRQNNRPQVCQEGNWRKDKNHKGNQNELISGAMPQLNNRKFCPVNTFEAYLSLLSNEVDYLWQTLKFSNYYDDKEEHYGPGHIGHNLLDDFMKRMSKLVKVGPYTNHSLRCTGITTLKRCKYTDKQIMSVSGHRSHSSLYMYEHVHENEKIHMGYSLGFALQNPSMIPVLDQENIAIAPRPAVKSLKNSKKKPTATV